MTRDSNEVCRLCGSANTSSCFGFDGHHIVHHLRESLDQTPGYAGRFDLRYCKSCGFLFSPGYFAPKELIYRDYITLSGQKEQPHAKRLIDNLKGFGVSHDSSIFEIGCNDGSFLDKLKADGFKEVWAVEPARDAYKRASERHNKISNVYFTRAFAEESVRREQFDVVVTRQVLEHIEDLDDFLQGISHVLQSKGILAIEVPDHTMSYTYLDYSFWEEHINYFTLSTIKKLLEKHGFKLIYHDSQMFSGQAITVYCKKFTSSDDFVGVGDEDLLIRTKYIDAFPKLKSEMRRYVEKKSLGHKGIFVYGAGCRSLCLVDWLGLNDLVTAFVDDSVQKIGRYTANGMHRIMSSKEVPDDGFFLLGVNCEIEERIIRKMGFKASQYASILPPSRYLPDFWFEMI